MNEIISFYKSENEVKGILTFFCSNKTINNSKNKYSDVNFDELLRKLSGKKVLQVCNDKNGAIFIYLEGWSVKCVINENKISSDKQYNLSVVSINKIRSSMHIKMIKTAELIGVENIYVEINRSTGVFTNYYNGQSCEKMDNPLIQSAYYSFIKINNQNKQRFSEEEETNEEEIEEEYIPNENLEYLLDIAANYANLQSELEIQKAQEKGQFYYLQYESIKDEKRKLRKAYRFVLAEDDFDDKLFTEKAMVDVELSDETRASAEIRKLERESDEDPVTAVELLFKDEDFDEKKLKKTNGIVYLSTSTVVRDVQLDAINKIRNGEAKAKYMDTVLGEFTTGTPQPYDKEFVDRQLKQEEYPPNESQERAIREGIQSADAYLVMGPPGTGKTTVIQQWVKYFVAKGKRVLISSKNNKAVDNVLVKFTDSKDVEMIRIGSEEKVDSALHPFIIEGRIENKRNDILDSTIRNQELIHRQIMNNSYVIDGARETINNITELKEAEDAYRTKLNEIGKMRASVHDQYTKYNEILDKLNKCLNNFDYLLNQYTDMKKHFGIISRILFPFKFRKVQRKIKDSAKEYSELKTQAENQKNVFNSTRNKYQTLIKETYDKEYKNFHFECDWLKTTLAKVRTVKKEVPSDWKLFTGVDESYPVNYDEALRECKTILDDSLKLLKLKEVMKRWHEETESQQNYALMEVILESVNVVGATCIGINSQKRFSSLDFDVTIIDEAGQIQIHDALVPMSVSNKLIMLGDHKQIPPSADQEILKALEDNGIDDKLMRISLFEMMYEKLPGRKPGELSKKTAKTMLDTQYRIPSQIADTISNWFYEGGYKSFKNNMNVKGIMKEFDYRSYIVVDTKDNPQRYEKKTESGGTTNELEARICAEIVRKLKDDYAFDLKEIGIISAYKDQVRLIRNQLKKFISNNTVANEMAATLDSFQGQERKIILYSFTRCAYGKKPEDGRIGFLNELRRLNVAMSRGKKQLIMIGDMDYLSNCMKLNKNNSEDPYEGSEKQFSDFIKKMLEDVKSENNSMYLTYNQYKAVMETAHE